MRGREEGRRRCGRNDKCKYSFRSLVGDVYKCDLKGMRDYFIKNMVFSSSLGSRECHFFALAILNQVGVRAFCGRNDISWRSIDGTEAYSEDAIFHAGLFYAVNKQGRIAVCGENFVVVFPRSSSSSILLQSQSLSPAVITLHN